MPKDFLQGASLKPTFIQHFIITTIFNAQKSFLKNSPHDVQTKGGGVKGLLNNVKKTALFLRVGFPKQLRQMDFINKVFFFSRTRVISQARNMFNGWGSEQRGSLLEHLMIQKICFLKCFFKQIFRIIFLLDFGGSFFIKRLLWLQILLILHSYGICYPKIRSKKLTINCFAMKSTWAEGGGRLSAGIC